METIAARKYAIIEKVMHLNEEELTELETSLIKFTEHPASIDQYNQESKKASPQVLTTSKSPFNF
ncbi:hypothetical protein [Lunatimonas salinarum]|uniref:hypothetical protein n=1 Tax=Lunatimonas salinarum TaxID=1774590 RepID=UPI001AE01E9B|nr:hypothetical protein [Lunatimonas salinarum]